MQKKVKVPVQMVDGQLEFLYGGPVPVLDGARGDLVVHSESIDDSSFLNLLKRKSRYPLLPAGEMLMVALTVKPEPRIHDGLRGSLIAGLDLGQESQNVSRRSNTMFVSINVGDPTETQEKLERNSAGGIWLEMEGMEPKSLATSAIVLPDAVSGEHVDSLNYAFTLLSEVYEPWRKSHTGNVYDRVLYQEADNRWYPLDVLRSLHVAGGRHRRAQECWSEIERNIRLAR